MDGVPVWLLGLPVDPVSLDEACTRIADAGASGRRLFFATPNLNFLRLARGDAAFTRSVLRCELSLADGVPLLWLARGLGVALPERVAGSSVVERLRSAVRGRPLGVCFFGGAPGVGERARAALDAEGGGLRGAGAVDPGFCSLDEMSSAQMIDAVNETDADLLVVALGARNGHLWLDRNRDRLTIPVASHLGAVVNFVAGTVARAPEVWQRLGLEWLWRIRQEPALASRYLRDGVFLLAEIAGALPRILVGRALRRLRAQGRDGLHIERNAPGTLRPVGALTAMTVPALLADLEAGAERYGAANDKGADVVQVIDLSGVDDLDAVGIGLLYAAAFRRSPGCELRSPSPAALRLLRLHRAEILLTGPAR